MEVLEPPLNCSGLCRLEVVVDDDPGDHVRCLDGGVVRRALVTGRRIRLVARDGVEAARIRLNGHRRCRVLLTAALSPTTIHRRKLTHESGRLRQRQCRARAYNGSYGAEFSARPRGGPP